MDKLEEKLDIAVKNYTQLGGVIQDDQKKQHESKNTKWYVVSTGQYHKVSYRPQTGRASAFVSQNIMARAWDVVDRVKIFLSSSLITARYLIIVCHAVWAYVGGPKIFGALGPLGQGSYTELLETRLSRSLPTYVTVLSLVARDQTVRTGVDSVSRSETRCDVL